MAQAPAKSPAKKKAVSPAEFVRQVRREAGKITWPTRKETFISTIMVVVMASVAALFFLLVDGLASTLIQMILGIGV